MLARLTVAGIIVTLACGAAQAAGLPADLFDVAAGTPWRFDLPQVTWPGSTWNGSTAPPGATSPNAPKTWGRLVLSAKSLQDLPSAADPKTIIVPASPDPAVVDGVLGQDEWADAQQVVYPFGQGRALVLLLKHTATDLFVAVACPSQTWWRTGQFVDLYFERPAAGCETIGPQHWLVRLLADREGQPLYASAVGKDGHWSPANPIPGPEPHGWRGSLALGGDGAWAYLVGEYALPLSELGGAKGTLPPPVGFAARMRLEGTGRRLPHPPYPPREAVYWPDARSAYGSVSGSPLGERPDFWGRLGLAKATDLQRLMVPECSAPITVDGVINPQEWGAATKAIYDLPGDQWRILYVMRDAQNLYVGVQLRSTRGPRSNVACSVYLDPLGDGGLHPHADDLRFRLRAGQGDGAETMVYADGRWRATRKRPLKAACKQLNDYETGFEFAIPWSSVGKCSDSPGLAVEVSYELRQP